MTRPTMTELSGWLVVLCGLAGAAALGLAGWTAIGDLVARVVR